MHFVTGFEPGRCFHTRSHTGRCSAADDVTGFKGHPATDVGNQLLDGKDHGFGIAVLTNLAIDFQSQVQVLRIGYFIFCHHPRAQRTKSIAAFALVPLAGVAFELKFAFRDIIDDAITRHIIKSIAL